MTIAQELAGWKDAAQTASYIVAALAALFAVWTYYTNSRRERAKWAVQLYEKFFEGTLYKETRDKLDCELSSYSQEYLQKLVRDAPATFTDYLNFFELVSFLAETKQLARRDVLKLFDYYLRSLKGHAEVLRYINDKSNGFEQLSRFLEKLDRT
ncbi:MAG: hypothetical protein ACLPND_01420 [Candidatus Korobacteraceae bacterium]